MSHPEQTVTIRYLDRFANISERTVQVSAEEAVDEDYRRMLLGERAIAALAELGLRPVVVDVGAGALPPDIHGPSSERSTTSTSDPAANPGPVDAVELAARVGALESAVYGPGWGRPDV